MSAQTLTGRYTTLRGEGGLWTCADYDCWDFGNPEFPNTFLVLVEQCVCDMNMPKFVFDDVPLFYGLITDLFPGLKAERVGYEDLKERIIEALDEKRCKHNDEPVFED